MNVPPCAIPIARSGAAAIVVASLAVSLDVLTSPPPLTATVFVTLAGAAFATFTVNVIAG